MERDKLVDLVALRAVARARRVELREQLRDVAEDHRVYARARKLSDYCERELGHDRRERPLPVAK